MWVNFKAIICSHRLRIVHTKPRYYYWIEKEVLNIRNILTALEVNFDCIVADKLQSLIVVKRYSTDIEIRNKDNTGANLRVVGSNRNSIDRYEHLKSHCHQTNCVPSIVTQSHRCDAERQRVDKAIGGDSPLQGWVDKLDEIIRSSSTECKQHNTVGLWTSELETDVCVRPAVKHTSL